MKSIGLFGGSFDPIHFGHIGLAIDLLEKHKLDQVLFCPAFCSPFRIGDPPKAKAEDRLAMLKLALDLPQFGLLTLEIERGGISYTVDTLRELRKQRGMALFLLLSDEAFARVHQWKESEEILKMAKPLIAPREIKISSTQIRERIRNGRYCNHLVPIKTLDYIHNHRLYSV